MAPIPEPVHGHAERRDMNVICLIAALAVALPWSELDVKKFEIRMWDTLVGTLSPVSHDLRGLAEQLESRVDLIDLIAKDYAALGADVLRLKQMQDEWIRDLSGRVGAGRPTWTSIVDTASYRRVVADIAEWELASPDDSTLYSKENQALALYKRLQERETTLSGHLVIFNELGIAEQSRERWPLESPLFSSFAPMEEARAEQTKLQMRATRSADIATAIAAWRTSRRTMPRQVAALWRQGADRQWLAAMRAEGHQIIRGWEQESKQRNMLLDLYSDAMARMAQTDALLDRELAPCAARRAALANDAWYGRRLTQLNEAGSVATDSILSVVVAHVRQRLDNTLVQADMLCEKEGPRYIKARQRVASAYLARGNNDGSLSCTEEARELTEETNAADEEEIFALWSQRCVF